MMDRVRVLLRRLTKLLGFGRPRPTSSRREDTVTTLPVEQTAGETASADAPPLTYVESEYKARPAAAPPLTPGERAHKEYPAAPPPLTPGERAHKEYPAAPPPLTTDESANKAGPADLPPLSFDVSAFGDRAETAQARGEEVDENLPPTQREPG
jgi:hypothetical protein